MTDREQELLVALHSSRDVEREEAARAMRDERHQTPALREVLAEAARSDPDPTVRYYAVQTLWLDVELLAAVLTNDAAHSIRREAARSLFGHAETSATARRALVAALHDRDFEVRQLALWQLERAPELTRRLDLVPALIALLDDGDEAVRELAATALGCAGACAEPALARLEAIEHEAHVERDLRDAARSALELIRAAGGRG